ncbi:MAG: hypothetical protein ACHQVS_00990 [Candidatus Babeliales bacterium]
MKAIVIRGVALLTLTSGLYASEEERKAKVQEDLFCAIALEKTDAVAALIITAKADDNDDVIIPTVRDSRSADERWQRWKEEDQKPEKQAQKLEREKAVQESINVIVLSCTQLPFSLETTYAAAASLPADIHRLIWKLVGGGEEIRKKRLMMQHGGAHIIPAVFPYGDYLATKRKLFDCIDLVKIRGNDLLIDLATNAHGLLPDASDPRLYVQADSRVILERGHLGSRLIQGHNEYFPHLVSERNQLDIKPKEFNALHYTNRGTIFKVDDATRAQFEELSEEQLKFLAWLYASQEDAVKKQSSDALTLTQEQKRIFVSLPNNILTALIANYTFTNVKITKNAADITRATAMYAALAPVATAALYYIITFALRIKG